MTEEQIKAAKQNPKSETGEARAYFYDQCEREVTGERGLGERGLTQSEPQGTKLSDQADRQASAHLSCSRRGCYL